MFVSGSTAFGRYRLLERLGHGGMAVVYRAETDDSAGGGTRDLVIKRILEPHSRDPHFVGMLISEARVSALLRHAAIVQMYELGAVDGEHYIAMEYVDGRNLTSILRACVKDERRLPAGLACFVVRELAAALGYAHALEDADGRPLRIVHRDVSPSNVMISKSGAVKLLDFGIAKAAEHFRDEHTTTGALKGKISYMSPEQANARPLDARSDIFSLGIVFWETLTARRLFKGETDLHSLRLIREVAPSAPSTLAPGIDADVDAVVLKMLARDPAKRFASCGDVVQALTPIVARSEADADALARFVAELGGGETSAPSFSDLPAVRAPRRAETVVLVAGAPFDEPRTVTSSLAGATRITPSRTNRWKPRRRLVAAGVTVASSTMLLIALARRAREPTPSLGVTPPASVATAVTTTAAAVGPPAPPVTAAAPPLPSSPPSSSAPSPPPPPERTTVHIHVAGDRGARVLLDGKPVGVIPLDADVPRRANATLLVTQPRHDPWRLGISLANDLSVRVPHLQAHARARTRPPAPPEMMNPFRRK